MSDPDKRRAYDSGGLAKVQDIFGDIFQDFDASDYFSELFGEINSIHQLLQDEFRDLNAPSFSSLNSNQIASSCTLTESVTNSYINGQSITTKTTLNGQTVTKIYKNNQLIQRTVYAPYNTNQSPPLLISLSSITNRMTSFFGNVFKNTFKHRINTHCNMNYPTPVQLRSNGNISYRPTRGGAHVSFSSQPSYSPF